MPPSGPLVALTSILFVAEAAGLYRPARLRPLIYWMLIFTTIAFAWRAAVRFVLVGREYGWSEGLAAVVRMARAGGGRCAAGLGSGRDRVGGLLIRGPSPAGGDNFANLATRGQTGVHACCID